ncbi:MAG: sugar ABC transporter permease [Armatimonadota bacterium]|nr:sugar ABC transporter permease [Armatimonadota bacterium]MDR7400676.1 sugar ABC transporter permease [Armatimonadota bacterium]MDR7403204.1 sugar ABC transporter permease [Armatimonadota bacterium]MDR7436513.1 sugar ABC transporter permease [Armatimonadota bacterium]MDR7472548.1 sugar ABC transporter permease [Armatimonadota bacterium]
MALRREAAVPPAAVAVRRRTAGDREDLLARLMLAPALVYVVLLVGAPLILAVLLSFTSATAGSLTFTWVGLRNFSQLVRDSQFQLALRNTVVFTLVSQALVIVLAVTAAHVLEAAFVGRRVVRFLLLLPWAAPVSLAAMAWTWIFDSTFSVINWTLKVAGLLRGWLYWFGDPTLAMIAIITVHVWRMFPFATVVVLAGMSAIPQDVREAAVIDGAGFFRRLVQVQLPLLLPIVTVSVLFGVVFTSTDLGVVWLLTRGGPYNSTHVLSTLAFQRGILGASLGQGAAVALFLLPVLVVVAAAMLRVARRAEVGG